MVMDKFPSSAFSPIDIRYSMLQADWVPGHLELAMLDTHLVSHVPVDLDKLILQSKIRVRGHFGYSVK